MQTQRRCQSEHVKKKCMINTVTKFIFKKQKRKGKTQRSEIVRQNIRPTMQTIRCVTKDPGLNKSLQCSVEEATDMTTSGDHN